MEPDADAEWDDDLLDPDDDAEPEDPDPVPVVGRICTLLGCVCFLMVKVY